MASASATESDTLIDRTLPSPLPFASSEWSAGPASSLAEARRPSLWSRLGSWAIRSSELGDRRAFLQHRVALYARLLLVLLVVFCGLDLVVAIILGPGHGQSYDTTWWAVGYGGIALCFALVWLAFRRGEHSTRRLEMAEASCTLLATTTCALGLASAQSWLATESMGSLAVAGLVLGVVLILVMRAALVPSSAARTLVIGLSSAAAIAVAAYVGHDIGPQPHPLPTALEGSLALGMWATVFAVITAINSRVIYGLQARVRQAMRVGQYTLEQKVGEGGMGVVYKARHSLLRRPTAVKLLPPDRAGECAVRHFEREVQQTSRLRHPNTVAIYDYGRTPDGIFYYAMEYLDGLSLQELVELEGPLPPGRVIHILTQACHALAEAHDVGLVHRDVKPANILLVDCGGVADHVKLVDFGLVKQLDADGRVDLTHADKLEGTPMYTAPESLVAPRDLDARVDLYALGAVGYFLLTGQPVFDGGSVVEVMAKHLKVEPEPPSKRLGRALPSDLETLILRCIAKDPEDRPQSAGDLWVELRACRDAGDWSIERAQSWWSERLAAIASLRQAARRGDASRSEPPAALEVALAERA